MDEVYVSVAACFLLAVGIALSTFLFVTLKQEMQHLRRRAAEQEEGVTELVERIQQDLEAVREAIADVERKASRLPQMSPPRPGMNTTRRSQVLRMRRRGESPQHIAAALGLPQGEVDLLLKVHQAVTPDQVS